MQFTPVVSPAVGAILHEDRQLGRRVAVGGSVILAGVDVEDLRLAVYWGFAEDGRAAGLGQLARRLNASREEVASGLRELARAGHLVLGGAAGAEPSVLMAHPFSAVPLGFAAMGPAMLWWGGCAWDSFALPHLVLGAGEVLVSTRCPACRSLLGLRSPDGNIRVRTLPGETALTSRPLASVSLASKTVIALSAALDAE